MKVNITDYYLEKNGKKYQAVFKPKFGIIDRLKNEKGQDDFIYIRNTDKLIDVRPFRIEKG